MSSVTVIGAGLAGSECAWQLANRGVRVRLIEQKPVRRTPAQQTDFFAELVCSNSLRGAALHNAVGLLKEELRRMDSLIMKMALAHQVPAGGALAVEREAFSQGVTQALQSHPNILIEATTVERLPDDPWVVVATGPLTGDALAQDLARVIGEQQLAYYDAIAPIVSADSLDWSIVFRASRYDKGGDDAYANCPLDAAQYQRLVTELCQAEKVPAHAFEEPRYFEGCLPVEVMAQRGERTLAFGPMKPVGLTDPRTGRWPHAVVQLRMEDPQGTAYNMVGFQTRMKIPEQKRVFAMIPGLENAEFLRYGTIHRNTFVNSPQVLADDFSLRAAPHIFLAGQISGVEGYIESAASGFVIGCALAARLGEGTTRMPPRETALGSLMSHLRKPNKDFQPSNIMWSMFPELTDSRLRKRARHEALAQRALESIDRFREQALPKVIANAALEHTSAIV